MRDHEFEQIHRLIKKLGGNLASVHSAEQNSWMYSHVNKHEMWLGSKQIMGVPPSIWEDGTQMDFVSFAEGEPRPDYDQGEDHDCLM